jgi:hypothetical protein
MNCRLPRAQGGTGSPDRRRRQQRILACHYRRSRPTEPDRDRPGRQAPPAAFHPETQRKHRPARRRRCTAANRSGDRNQPTQLSCTMQRQADSTAQIVASIRLFSCLAESAAEEALGDHQSEDSLMRCLIEEAVATPGLLGAVERPDRSITRWTVLIATLHAAWTARVCAIKTSEIRHLHINNGDARGT